MAKNTKERSTRVTTWNQAIPEAGLVLITGDIGEGKSGLAWKLADDWHKKGRPVVAYAFTSTAQAALPKWVHHIGTPAEIRAFKPRRSEKGPALMVVDEAALNINARRFMSEDNVGWTRLMAIIRHMGFVVVLIAQSNRQPDVQMVMSAHTVLMKRPTELHVRFSRQELRQETQEAFEHFAGLSDREAKRHTFIADFKHGKRGWLTNGLPTWWGDKVSRAFQDAEFEAIVADGKGPARKKTSLRTTGGRVVNAKVKAK